MNIIHYSLLCFSKNKAPVFGYFWSSSCSHESLADVADVDEHQRDFIDEMERKGHLENTIFLFMSDHGLRLEDYIL